MAPLKFEKNYRIHYYEIDNIKRALATSIMNYFDDIAIAQSEHLKIGFDFLTEKNLAWVLYRWDIDFKKFPVLNDVVKITTTPYSFNKFYAYRYFKVCNLQGEKLVTANSMWLLINTKKRRPVKIIDKLYEVYGIDKDKTTPLEFEELRQLTSIDYEKKFDVRYMDIDTNNHVNNVKYASWAFETVPLNIIKNYTLSNLKAIYKKETTYGQKIKALTEIIGKDSKTVNCAHKIISADDKELCLLESTWRI